MHQAALLPFVAGLGFRKANALRAAIRAQAGGAVLSRQQLLEEGFLTPKVGCVEHRRCCSSGVLHTHPTDHPGTLV